MFLGQIFHMFLIQFVHMCLSQIVFKSILKSKLSLNTVSPINSYIRYIMVHYATQKANLLLNIILFTLGWSVVAVTVQFSS